MSEREDSQDMTLNQAASRRSAEMRETPQTSHGTSGETQEPRHYVETVRLEGRSEADLTEIAMQTAELRGERIAELEADIRAMRERHRVDRERLRAFEEWGRQWVAERERRYGWRAVPGTVPPASFNTEPRRLNRELDALLAHADGSDD